MVRSSYELKRLNLRFAVMPLPVSESINGDGPTTFLNINGSLFLKYIEARNRMVPWVLALHTFILRKLTEYIIHLNQDNRRYIKNLSKILLIFKNIIILALKMFLIKNKDKSYLKDFFCIM